MTIEQMQQDALEAYKLCGQQLARYDPRTLAALQVLVMIKIHYQLIRVNEASQ